MLVNHIHNALFKTMTKDKWKMKKDWPVQYYKESVKGQGELRRQVKRSFNALSLTILLKNKNPVRIVVFSLVIHNEDSKSKQSSMSERDIWIPF